MPSLSYKVRMRSFICQEVDISNHYLVDTIIITCVPSGSKIIDLLDLDVFGIGLYDISSFLSCSAEPFVEMKLRTLGAIQYRLEGCQNVNDNNKRVRRKGDAEEQ